MATARWIFKMMPVIALVSICLTATAQQPGRAASPTSVGARRAESVLRGVYRLDTASSDKLYSVVAGATTNLPFGEQQRFFIDLTVRLTPPDQLAIEQRGSSVSIASSRAPRISFAADGIERTDRAADGHLIRTRATLNGDQLAVTSSGSSDDKFTVVFEPLEDGARLRVTRRIYAEQLNQPVIIQSIYNRISEVARWSIYGEPEAAAPTVQSTSATDSTMNSAPSSMMNSATNASLSAAESHQAATLRASLDEWIAATNARDVEKQMTFYLPKVEAFYLTRNVPREAVRAEKSRVFARATAVDVRAEAPEIIFRNAGRNAVMRFRKQYAIANGRQNRRGEVVQELRWQRTPGGWKISSERDVQVIR